MSSDITFKIPETKHYAVRRSDVERAWMRYSRQGVPKVGDADYVSYCAFEYGFCASYILTRGLDPDYNLPVLT